jgi:hypothetical protein
VRLNRTQLAQFLGILDKIDRGLSHPRVGDRIGRFIRQYESGRRDICAYLELQSVPCRSDGVVSGKFLHVIQASALLDPEVDELAFPLGEVASTLAICEELGGLLHVRMWLKATNALTAFNILRETSGLRLVGDYRWSPLAGLTPGEAQIEPSDVNVSWRNARCLKAVADDLLRPPHALEYVVDYRLGPPGLKFFRTICAIATSGRWQALPCFGQPRDFNVATIATEESIPRGQLVMLLIYREPWSNDWTVVRGNAVQPNEVLEHALAWADFRSELTDDPLDGQAIATARESLRPWGVVVDPSAILNLGHRLLPSVRLLLQQIRGTV